MWAAFGCTGAAYAAYCKKRCIWCCLVGHRVAYGLIWDICGGAFGWRWAAFGCTGDCIYSIWQYTLHMAAGWLATGGPQSEDTPI